MKNIIFKNGIVFMTSLMVGGILTTSVVNVKANSNTQIENVQNTSNSNEELQNLTSEDLETELAEALYKQGIEDIPSDENMYKGAKSKATKEATKVAIKGLKKMGKKSWNKAVESIPIAGQYFKKYLNYETVMKGLNIVTGFEGNIEDGISDYLVNTEGIPRQQADMISRTITGVLL